MDEIQNAYVVIPETRHFPRLTKPDFAIAVGWYVREKKWSLSISMDYALPVSSSVKFCLKIKGLLEKRVADPYCLLLLTWSYILRSSRNTVHLSHLRRSFASRIMVVIRFSRQLCSSNIDFARLNRRWLLLDSIADDSMC